MLQDGTHTIERSFHVTSRVLDAVYTELFDQRVDVFGTLLKPNMVLSGYDGRATAPTTTRSPTGRSTLPATSTCRPAVPGIVFLSGGQSDEDATANLNAMNAEAARTLAAVVLLRPGAAGPGAPGHGTARTRTPTAAQRAYYHRAKMNAAARTGSYAPEMEREAVAAMAT